MCRVLQCLSNTMFSTRKLSFICSQLVKPERTIVFIAVLPSVFQSFRPQFSEDEKRDNKDSSCRSNFIIPSNTATITYQVRIQYLLSTGVKVINFLGQCYAQSLFHLKLKQEIKMTVNPHAHIFSPEKHFISRTFVASLLLTLSFVGLSQKSTWHMKQHHFKTV